MYVLFSDKRFPMPCHTLSIQVCRSTCFVKCKHMLKGTEITVRSEHSEKLEISLFECMQSETQPHSHIYRTQSTVRVGCE